VCVCVLIQMYREERNRCPEGIFIIKEPPILGQRHVSPGYEMVSLSLIYYQYISIIISCHWQVAFIDGEVSFLKNWVCSCCEFTQEPLTSGDEPSAFD